MTTVTLIQDRLYAINQTIADVNARRTFPQEIAPAMLPLLVTLPGRSTRQSTRVGFGDDEQTRTFRLIVVVEAWMAGIPTESAQLLAETLMDTIQDEYLSRPRLELAGEALADVTRVVLGDDSGIIPFSTKFAAVEFPLAVTYLKSIQMNME